MDIEKNCILESKIKFLMMTTYKSVGYNIAPFSVRINVWAKIDTFVPTCSAAAFNSGDNSDA